jgi:hypothetical protein
VPRIKFPKFLVQRLLHDTFSLSLSVLLRGRLIYRVVLAKVVGDVLRVRRVVFFRKFERGKYEVLGGHISPFAVFSLLGGGIIKVEGLGNVRSGETSMVVGGLWWRP